MRLSKEMQTMLLAFLPSAPVAMPPSCWAGSRQEDDPLLLLLDIEWALFITSSAGQKPAQGIAVIRPSFQDKTMLFLAFHPQLLLRVSARCRCVSTGCLLAIVLMGTASFTRANSPSGKGQRQGKVMLTCPVRPLHLPVQCSSKTGFCLVLGHLKGWGW